MSKTSFQVLSKCGFARLGEFNTFHGSFSTPAFMPVGTRASVKGVNPRQLEELGAQIVLANSYHLHLRPGEQLIEKLGGIHRFMGWDKPILTDSGGFQVYSLSKTVKMSDEGVVFKSHLDGGLIELTPEKVVSIQEALGVDIMMPLDVCLPATASESEVELGMRRTHDWARRSKEAKRNESQFLFSIVQGAMSESRRRESAQALVDIGFLGYAIGGLSVGEPQEVMLSMLEVVMPFLPEDCPRYLMGVGMPGDIVEAVARGLICLTVSYRQGVLVLAGCLWVRGL